MHKPRTVDGILKKLKEKSDSGEYLYRGEPEHYMDHPFYGKVSSNLYRVFLEDKEFDVEDEQFDIEVVQPIPSPFLHASIESEYCVDLSSICDNVR